MKKIAIVSFIAMSAMVSCNKTGNEVYNTVTVQFQYNGANTLYSISGHDGATENQADPLVQVSVHRGANSSIRIFVNGSSPRPFYLLLNSATGPANGIGTYTIQAADSNSNVYTENLTGMPFSSAQSYKCSGGNINVTQCVPGNVSGNFTLNLFNANGSRTITGSFAGYQPEIQ